MVRIRMAALMPGESEYYDSVSRDEAGLTPDLVSFQPAWLTSATSRRIQ